MLGATPDTICGGLKIGSNNMIRDFVYDSSEYFMPTAKQL
jgi:hypothetical protein